MRQRIAAQSDARANQQTEARPALDGDASRLRSVLTGLVEQWRGHAKTNRIDAKDEAEPRLGEIAAEIHDYCADELEAALALTQGAQEK